MGTDRCGQPVRAIFFLKDWGGPMHGMSNLVLSILLLFLMLIGWSMPVVGEAKAGSEEPERPNILWISVEDMSPDLGSYGDSYADTPHLDAFAAQAVRYTRAFATAPVCSPARSCLITGLYATTLGTQRLRSGFPIPERFRGVPAYLREAGYYTTNNVKTDYNIADEKSWINDSWDANNVRAHWRDRPEGAPFFSVFNLMTTHQSRTGVWPYDQFVEEIQSRLDPSERHDPAEAPLPPYYPDTELTRRNVARYYDCISVMDHQVGDLLAQLEEDGLADRTIVVFFSDHGMGLPRGKRLLHDSGMQVPLIVRFPKRFADLAPAEPGETIDRLVSFVDFPPTLLSLAGVEVPGYVQGSAFLGPDADEPRQFIHGARDRVDEAFDMARSVRDDRYLYIRNYMPHLSWLPPEGYSDAAPMRRELLRLREDGQLDQAVLSFAAPRRAVEELCDVVEDPDQMVNLAGDPSMLPILDRFRLEHKRWTFKTRDLGYLPETDVLRRAGDVTPFEMGQDPERYPLGRIWLTAQLVGDPQAVPVQIQRLSDPDPAVRYWAALGLHAAGSEAQPAVDALRNALTDEAISVRVEAASALAGLGAVDEALEVLTEILKDNRPDAVLRAMRALQQLGSDADPARSAIEAVLERAKQGQQSRAHPCWLFVQFSASAWLQAKK